MYKKFGFILICLTLFNTSWAKKNLPVEYFNHLPMIQQPTISPDGKSIAVVYNQGEDTQVAIVPFDNPTDFNILIKLGAEKYRIGSIDWVNNERLIVSVSRPFKINTNKVRIPHLYSVGVDGKYIELKSNSYRKADNEWKKYASSSTLLSILDDDKDHILVSSRDIRDGRYSSVFKVHVVTGKYDKYLPNNKKIWNWGVNKQGHILIAYGGTGNDSNEEYIYVRDNENSKWEKIITLEPFKTETFQPLIYDNEKHILYVKSNYKLGKDAIWTYDTKKQEYIEVIGEAPGNLDVTGGIYSHTGKEYELVGYRYYDNIGHRVYFDESSNKLSRDIKGLFSKKGLNANITDYDSKKTKYIIKLTKNNKPSRYILFDTKLMKFVPWFSQYPELTKYELAKVESFSFNARDGMELHGYYTVSPEAKKNPPLILFPHGGPNARDYQGFDPFVQLFASRGYAVLQVNYRGSTGYGDDYMEAGFQQWGKKMQTDLIDALDWIKENRKADTNNACIVGASYGGYAALVAGFQTPKRFKCIASIAGISDMKKLVTHSRIRGYEEFIDKTVKISNDDLRNISPINHINEYKVPVLLIHGKADTSVDINQSIKMHDALKKAGKKSKFVTFKYGTHNLNDAANRKIAMKELDVFLKKHLN